MFLLRRPSHEAIERFLRESESLPLSYAPAGILGNLPPGRILDEAVVTIGHGREDFARARAALAAWRHFDIGWVEKFPRNGPITIGTVVAVLIRHLGCWSLNGARVLYHLGAASDDTRFGFAYGTLTNHAEGGEEIFEVFLDPRTGDVMYRIRATSWPRAAIARVGQPIVRLLQARFRDHSARAMARAVREAAAAV